MATLVYILIGWLGLNLAIVALMVWRVIPPKHYRENYQRIRLHAVPIPVTSRRAWRRA